MLNSVHLFTKKTRCQLPLGFVFYKLLRLHCVFVTWKKKTTNKSRIRVPSYSLPLLHYIWPRLLGWKHKSGFFTKNKFLS